MNRFTSTQPSVRRRDRRARTVVGARMRRTCTPSRGRGIVPVAGAPIPSGTIVMRNGLIEAVGADVQPSGDAIVIDGAGLTVYPGLIDMGNATGVEPRHRQAPRDLPDDGGGRALSPCAPTSVLTWRPPITCAPTRRSWRAWLPPASRASSPRRRVASSRDRARSSTSSGRPDQPQIGYVGDYRQGLQVVRTPVALHVDFDGGAGRGGYPASLHGHDLVRAPELHRRAASAARAGALRKATNAGVRAAGLRPGAERAAAGARWQVCRWRSRRTRRARSCARSTWRSEFKLDPIVTGAREADQVAEDLKSRMRGSIYNVNYPTRSRMLPRMPTNRSPHFARARTRRKFRRRLRRRASRSHSRRSGLREPRDFVRNVARAVREGLPADAALRALTLDAAKIAGAGDRLGTLEKGKIANLLVTEGDIFDNAMKVKHVFVDGRMIPIDDAPAPTGGRGGRGGQ